MASAGGRPLYVLLGLDPRATIARKVAERLERTQSDGERYVLAFAALAGPVRNETWRERLGVRVGLARRAVILGGADREVLKRVLPALQPEPFADQVLLAWARDRDEHERRTMFERALAVNAAAVERRLASLWSGRSGESEDKEVVEALQQWFDELAPERVAEIRAATWRAAGHLAFRVDLDTDSPERRAWEAAAGNLEHAAESRPFDREIRLYEAKGAVNAIARYGGRGLFEKLERWGKRLMTLARDPAFVGEGEIRLREAEGAVNAMACYGRRGRFEDLERWGARLVALAEAPAFAGDREIRLYEAKGAVNAIARYGDRGRFEDLERWGKRLVALAEASVFAGEREIRIEEAKDAVNAIIFYDKHGRPEGRELWAARLAALARIFPLDLEIQHYAARVLLTYVQQRANGWPYGRPDDASADGKA